MTLFSILRKVTISFFKTEENIILQIIEAVDTLLLNTFIIMECSKQNQFWNVALWTLLLSYFTHRVTVPALLYYYYYIHMHTYDDYWLLIFLLCTKLRTGKFKWEESNNDNLFKTTITLHESNPGEQEEGLTGEDSTVTKHIKISLATEQRWLSIRQHTPHHTATLYFMAGVITKRRVRRHHCEFERWSEGVL